MNKWQVFVARVSVFPTLSASSPSPDSLALFKRMWGIDPDSFQKAQNPLSPSTSQGKRDGLTISCIAGPTRADFSVTGTPRQPLELALIQRGEEVRTEVQRIVEAIGRGEGPTEVSRVALFVQALIPTSETLEANRILSTTVPLKLSNENEEEVVFQVNRRYQAKVLPNRDMNAVIKWSVETFQIVAIPMLGALGPENVPTNPQRREVMAAVVSFDINNRPGQFMLDAAEQSALLREALDVVSRTQREIHLNIEGL